MLRTIIRALQYLDAALHADRCPRRCSESHTDRWPCAVATRQRDARVRRFP